MIKKLLIGAIVLLPFCTYASEDTRDKADNLTTDIYSKINLETIKSTSSIKIDGVINEVDWQAATVASGFTTYSPTIGEEASSPTEVKVTYDDRAIYIAAKMYDQRENILKSLSKRDQRFPNADQFYIVISPFNDNQNYFKFLVTAANVQYDAIITNSSTDSSWDAVWRSSTRIEDDCWVAEIAIPYSALRFPEQEVESWGINFWREKRKMREISVWNPVDRSISSWINQSGNLDGISVQKPPQRLELYPYISSSIVSEGDQYTFSYGGGLDLKYGINSSYTLDVTLVPDFSQTKSDQEVLNLTPYETAYSENRAFFNEGTELFTKASIFYSRRIGQKPHKYYEADDNLSEDEIVVSNDLKTKLVNATKLSGRSSKGAGLGFFNAMTSASEAVIKDTVTEETRTFRTQGFTNFNMLVYDQIFKKFSYFNISNTNRNDFGCDKNDNVLSGMVKYSGEKNRFSFTTNGKWSTINNSEGHISDGFYFYTKYEQTTGKIRPTFYVKVMSDEYDINGMGYNSKNNEIQYYGTLSYNIFEPSKRFLSWSMSTRYYQLREYVNNDIFVNKIRLKGSGKTLNNNNLSLSVESSFGETHNYKETRTTDNFYIMPNSTNMEGSISTNYAKPFALDLSGSLKLYADRESEIGYDKGGEYEYNISPRFRLSDKIMLIPTIKGSFAEGEVGYIGQIDSDTIVFGQRDNRNSTYSIDAEYIFNNKMFISLNARHYWSRVNYNKFFTLNNDGTLMADNKLSYSNINYNALNMDLNYSWNFAPGSFFTFMWKYNISESTSDIPSSYKENLIQVRNYTPTNTVSMKISYYIDYGMITSIFKG